MTDNYWLDLGFQALELAHGPAWQAMIQADPPQTSELTFTNMFMWRQAYGVIWRIERGCLQIIAVNPVFTGGRPFALPPLGPGDKSAALANLLEVLAPMTPTPMVRRLSEKDARQYINPSRQQALLDRDQSDYVYLAEDLAKLKGNRLHRKKNHLNRFKRSADYQYKPLTASLVDKVKAAQERWLDSRIDDTEHLADEHRAIMEALDNFGRLPYQGGVILIDGQVEAYSLGEELSPDTAVIHIEKANVNIPGIYAAINQMFCQNAWSQYTYINREQDLGIPGLRAAKESYLPHHLVHKYTITPCPGGSCL